MQNQKELHVHIEYNEHDRMQNHTPAEQLGYEHDSEEEADFDHADADISLGEVRLTQNVVDLTASNLLTEETDYKERCNSQFFSSDSDQDNLKRSVDPNQRKRKMMLIPTPNSQSTQSDTCGITTQSEEDSKQFGSMLHKRANRFKQAFNKFSFQRDLEFTTTEGSEIEHQVPRQRLTTLAECTDDETDADCNNQQGEHQTRVMAAASSDEETTFKNKRTPEYLRQQVRSKKQPSLSQTGLKLRIAIPSRLSKNYYRQDQEEPLSSIPEEVINAVELTRCNSNAGPVAAIQQTTVPLINANQAIDEINQKAVSVDEAQKQNQHEDNPTRGIIFMIISTIFMVIANTLSKEQFVQSPALGVLELIFARGVISIVMLLCWVNKNAKTELIDKIEAANLPALTFRCISGGIVQIISFQSIKYFNVSTVGMVCSLAPIIVCGLAYFLLGERMSRTDVLFFVAVFSSCTMVLLGAGNQTSSGNEVAEAASVIAFICLLSQPVLIAGQVIANRTMRKMSEVVVSTYVQVTLTIVIGVLMIAQGASFSFLLNFSAMSWFLLIASSLVNILSSTTKFLACKYHTASDLQKLAFLPNVWQFCIDITFMKATFSGLELAGFVALFLFYGAYLALIAASTCLQKKTADDIQDEFTKCDDLEQGQTLNTSHQSTESTDRQSDRTEQKENLFTYKQTLVAFFQKKKANQEQLLDDEYPKV